MACVHACHCVTTTKLLSSSAGQECYGCSWDCPFRHGFLCWSIWLTVPQSVSHVCTHAPLCVCVCIPLENMLPLPQAGQEKENSTKQTWRRNHLGWRGHQISIVETERISGSTLLPLKALWSFHLEMENLCR